LVLFALLGEVAMFTLTTRDPGYQRHCRDDRRPVLGNSPSERLARLGRLRAALALAGWGEAEANRHARAKYGQLAIELLTADEADEVIAMLAGGAAREGEAR
jgi:hypothetical protein